jgi:methionyl-tRNA formyltransferase
LWKIETGAVFAMASCLIIGQGTLPVLCANLLAKHEIDVRAVSSPDKPLRTWATDRDVPHFTSLSGFATFAGLEPFDYLFSVVNYRILHGSLLSLPKRLAINYHDSALPKYAGVHSTTWAILNGETTHGVTWHVMDEGVDTGDILKQATIPIGVRDTAHQLNLRCYYTGIALFSELIGELKSGTFKRTKQDLGLRTYFGLSKRPDHDCLISFKWPARQIDAFWRALDFESSPNPIGRPRIIIGGRLLMVPRIELTGIRSRAIPGTVIDINNDSVEVATSTENVVIPTIHTLGGRALPIGELREFGLAVGTTIDSQSLMDVSCPEQL